METYKERYREAEFIYLIGAVAGVLLLLFGLPVVAAGVLLAALAPWAYHYFHYKQLEAGDEHYLAHTDGFVSISISILFLVLAALSAIIAEDSPLANNAFVPVIVAMVFLVTGVYQLRNPREQ